MTTPPSTASRSAPTSGCAPTSDPRADETAQAPVYRACLRADRTTRTARVTTVRAACGPAGSAATARLATRLTTRDRWILAMLAEHRVLTSTHIAMLAFGTRRVATLRMARLYELGVVHRFRPWTATGSTPWHFVLAPPGAAVVADDLQVSVADLDYSPERLSRLAVSLHLAHTVGANDVVVRLAAHTRTSPGDGHLRVWWSERRCHSAWAGRIRPDAYGRWRLPSRRSAKTMASGGSITAEIDWFLEYDLGTENLDRVTAKLTGYADLAASTGLTTPVLFWLPSPAREENLRDRIHAWQGADPRRARLPVATANQAYPGGPAGRVWALVEPGPAARSRAGTPCRVRLADLARSQPTPAGPAAAVSAPSMYGTTVNVSPAPAVASGVRPWPAPSPLPPVSGRS
jgi:hypothetical protein